MTRKTGTLHEEHNIFNVISVSSSQNEKCFRQKL